MSITYEDEELEVLLTTRTIVNMPYVNAPAVRQFRQLETVQSRVAFSLSGSSRST